jgi:hypothetical protein
MRANVVETAKRPRKSAAAKPQLRVVESATGIKKINLGALANNGSGRSSRASHPMMEVSEETRALLEQFLQIEPQFKELEKQSKSLKQQISPAIKSDYFRQFAGATAPDSTLIAHVGDKRVRLVFSENRYSSLCADDRAIIATIGPELAGQFFSQATELKLDLDKVPEEKQQPLIEAVLAAAQKLGITDGISAKQYIKPRPGFHAARTRLLTPEQNAQIDAALPMSAYAQLERP